MGARVGWRGQPPFWVGSGWLLPLVLCPHVQTRLSSDTLLAHGKEFSFGAKLQDPHPGEGLFFSAWQPLGPHRLCPMPPLCPPSPVEEDQPVFGGAGRGTAVGCPSRGRALAALL